MKNWNANSRLKRNMKVMPLAYVIAMVLAKEKNKKSKGKTSKKSNKEWTTVGYISDTLAKTFSAYENLENLFDESNNF